jgi:multidrug efflux system membrane fusion protein
VVDGEREAVKAGLKPGEIVVTEGADRLRDGAQVQLPKSEAPASPAAAARPATAAPPGQPAAQGRRRGNGTGSGRPPPSS